MGVSPAIPSRQALVRAAGSSTSAGRYRCRRCGAPARHRSSGAGMAHLDGLQGGFGFGARSEHLSAANDGQGARRRPLLRDLASLGRRVLSHREVGSERRSGKGGEGRRGDQGIASAWGISFCRRPDSTPPSIAGFSAEDVAFPTQEHQAHFFVVCFVMVGELCDRLRSSR